jgi:hypothetical protein
VMGIGFGNIFSGKQIELKTKDSYAGNRSPINNEKFKKTNDEIIASPTTIETTTTNGGSGVNNNNDFLSSLKKTSPQPTLPSNAIINNDTMVTSPLRKKIKQKARVLYEYLPTQEDELKLTVGEIIYILDKNLEDDGWWKGESVETGQVGVFPDNFVEEISSMSTPTNKVSPPTPATTTTTTINQQQKSLNNNNNDQHQNNKKVIANSNGTFISSNSNHYIDNNSNNNNQNRIDNSLATSSSSSASSSSNSLPRAFDRVIPTTPAAQSNGKSINDQANGSNGYHHNNNNTNQNNITDELNTLMEANKLVHMKKTRQFNKRPPSFRSKSNKVNISLYF